MQEIRRWEKISQSTAQKGADLTNGIQMRKMLDNKKFLKVVFFFFLLRKNMGEVGTGWEWWMVHISSQCMEIFVHLCFMKLLPKLMLAPKAQK